MYRLIILLFIVMVAQTAYGQNERKFVRSGNKLFMEAVKDTSRLDTTKFGRAEEFYRKALDKKPDSEKWDFNLADAMYKQMRFEEAERKFNTLTEKLETKEEKARALHNQGNSQLMQQKIDESIESYKEALRNNPNDLETKYNLVYAQMMKNQQQQQQQDQKDQQDKQDQQNNQDNQDQQNNQDNQDNQDQKDQQNSQDQQDRQDRDQQQQQQQQQNKISREDAEQLLQALENDEKDIQEKVNKNRAAKGRKIRTEKEW